MFAWTTPERHNLDINVALVTETSLRWPFNVRLPFKWFVIVSIEYWRRSKMLFIPFVAARSRSDCCSPASSGQTSRQLQQRGLNAPAIVQHKSWSVNTTIHLTIRTFSFMSNYFVDEWTRLCRCIDLMREAHGTLISWKRRIYYDDVLNRQTFLLLASLLDWTSSQWIMQFMLHLRHDSFAEHVKHSAVIELRDYSTE